MNRTRNLGLACNMYADENKDLIPPGLYNDQPAYSWWTWTRFVYEAGYMELPNGRIEYGKDRELYHETWGCPEVKFAAGCRYKSTIYNCYLLNGGEGEGYPTRRAGVRRPSELVLIGCGKLYYNSEAGWDSMTRHMSGSNFIYYDLHTRWRSFEIQAQWYANSWNSLPFFNRRTYKNGATGID